MGQWEVKDIIDSHKTGITANELLDIVNIRSSSLYKNLNQLAKSKLITVRKTKKKSNGIKKWIFFPNFTKIKTERKMI